MYTAGCNACSQLRDRLALLGKEGHLVETFPLPHQSESLKAPEASGLHCRSTHADAIFFTTLGVLLDLSSYDVPHTLRW